MIRFCDKEVYTIQADSVDRDELLAFFYDGHETDVVRLVDGNCRHIGIATLRGLKNAAESNNPSNYIFNEIVRVGLDFWQDAKKIFAIYSDELLPIEDEQGNLVGFCFDDPEYLYNGGDMRACLRYLDEEPCTGMFINYIFPGVKQFVLWDVNEFTYLFANILIKNSIEICVIGEKWEWFGFKSYEGFDKYPDYQRVLFLAEGSTLMRREDINYKWRYECHKEPFYLFLNICQMILSANRQMIYEKLKKDNISFAVVNMPWNSEVTYLTDEEILCRQLDVCQEEYVRNNGNISEDRKRALFAVKDEKTCEYLLHRNIPSKKINPIALKCESRKIYLIGPCIVEGGNVLPSDTLVKCIEKYVDNKYTIIPILARVYDFNGLKDTVQKLPISHNDVVIFIDRGMGLDRAVIDNYIDMVPRYNEVGRKSWFDLTAIHTNVEGNREVAKLINEEFLQKELLKKKNNPDIMPYIRVGELVSEETKVKIQEYIESIVVRDNCETIGGIVMNCNPFTYGHQYLIETAAAQVDLLYVFVVSEDSSEFKFADRFEMVKAGTSHISNVQVVPSGEFILSWNTFSAYFDKKELQEAKVDSKVDLHIFARYIAPALGISVRFVGEEPFDNVTRQYNEQMKEVFNQLGNLELRVIPRKTTDDGVVISASKVRESLENLDLEELKKMVPKTSLAILKRGENG